MRAAGRIASALRMSMSQLDLRILDPFAQKTIASFQPKALYAQSPLDLGCAAFVPSCEQNIQQLN